MDIKELDLSKLKKEELISLVESVTRRLEITERRYRALEAKMKGLVGYGAKKNPHVK